MRAMALSTSLGRCKNGICLAGTRNQAPGSEHSKTYFVGWQMRMTERISLNLLFGRIIWSLLQPFKRKDRDSSGVGFVSAAWWSFILLSSHESVRSPCLHIHDLVVSVQWMGEQATSSVAPLSCGYATKQTSSTLYP